jgi:aminopeptidase N
MVRRVVVTAMVVALAAACAPGTDDRAVSAPATGPAPPPAAPAPAIDDGALDTAGTDSVVPGRGRPDLDVEHYDVALETDAVGSTVTARAALRVRPRRAADRLVLDFAMASVDSVTVEGRPAGGTADGERLTVTPAEALVAGRPVTVEVRYRGTPRPRPTPTLGGAAVGWQAGPGGSLVMSEPEGAASWVPVNDTVVDKATWTVAVTVPAGRSAVANGRLDATTDGPDGRRTFRWVMDRPMATYQVTVVVGDLRATDGGVVGGVTYRYWTVADSPVPPALADSPGAVARLEAWLGPFPYEVYGGLVYPPAFVPEGPARTLLGSAAFEAPGVSIYAEGRTVPEIVAHETAHQWMGDSVSVRDWGRDLWWVEGFARFAEVAGTAPDALDRPGAFAVAERRCRGVAASPVPAPGLFSSATYDCGALVFAALRAEVGDGPFRAFLRTFAARHAHGTAGTDDLVAVASEVAGRDLAPFFRLWLSARRPALG